MKRRKSTCALVILICLFLFSSCFWNGNPETAEWEDYPGMSFKEFLREACGKMADEEEEYTMTDIQYRVSWEEGWEYSDKLDKDDLARGKKAVTYKVEVKIVTPDEEEINELYFFMEMDHGQLRAKGMSAYEEGDFIYEDSRRDTELFLEELVEDYM